jgi:hypothetical protein
LLFKKFDGVDQKFIHHLHLLDFKPISDRLCTLRIRGRCRNLSIINVHAPSLEELLNSMLKHDIKIVNGDFNAKVGKEQHHLCKNIGAHSLHGGTNGRGSV